jgi:hypothetical protein
MHQVQQSVLADHALRVFGREAEAIDERAAKRAKLQKEHDLYMIRNEATEATKYTTAAMKEKYNANMAYIMRKNILVTRGSCGLTPANLKRKLGEEDKRISARSRLSMGGVGAALMWETAAAELTIRHDKVNG